MSWTALGEQPGAQMLQDFLYLSTQFVDRDFAQVGGARGCSEFLDQLGREFVGMTFNHSNQCQGNGLFTVATPCPRQLEDSAFDQRQNDLLGTSKGSLTTPCNSQSLCRWHAPRC